MTEHQQKMNAFRTEHDKAIDSIKSDEDLTDEARSRKLKEERARYESARQAEEQRESERLTKEHERAYKEVHKEREPEGSTQEAILYELRRGRVRDQLEPQYANGSRSPALDYKEAVRLGDDVRQAVIAEAGAKHPELAERLALSRLVYENQPAHVREAREELAGIERQQREVSLGAALHNRVANDRRRRLGG